MNDNTSAQSMTVERIMTNYAPVYPDQEPTWLDTISYLMNTPAQARIVKRLQEILAEEGTFREPVLLESQESRDEANIEAIADGYPEDVNDGKLNVLDGTHRVVAAYLSQHESIPVTIDSWEMNNAEEENWDNELAHMNEHSWEQNGNDEENEDTFLTTDIFFKIDQELTTEAVDYLMSNARSFELTPSIWVTASCASLSTSSAEMTWDADEEEIARLTEDDMENLSAMVYDALSESEMFRDFRVETYVTRA